MGGRGKPAVDVAIEIRTEGGPLVVGSDVGGWRGAAGGSGAATLSLGGLGVDRLPARFRPSKKTPTRQTLAFDTAAEAEEAAREATKLLLAITPAAAKLPGYEHHPGYYVDGKRAFVVEIVAESDLSRALDATKRGAGMVGGHLVVSVEAGPLRISRSADRVVLGGAADVPLPKRALKSPLALGSELHVFPAGLAFSAMRRGPGGALFAPDQATPAGVTFGTTQGRAEVHVGDELAVLVVTP